MINYQNDFKLFFHIIKHATKRKRVTVSFNGKALKINIGWKGKNICNF